MEINIPLPQIHANSKGEGLIIEGGEMSSEYGVECVLFFVQTSMSVRVMTQTTVTRMHSALIQRGAIPALATLAILEMGSAVQVS